VLPNVLPYDQQLETVYLWTKLLTWQNYTLLQDFQQDQARL